MDFLFNIIKQLSSSTSVGDLLLMIIFIVIACFYILRFVLKLNGKGGILSKIFETEDPNEKVLTKLDENTVRTTHILTLLDNVKQFQIENDKEHQRQNEMFRSHINDMNLIKRDVDLLNSELNQAVNTLKDIVNANSAAVQSTREQILYSIQRGHDIMVRLESNISKVDEFVHSSTPEFRASFKEISKEISEISLDIALIERSMNNQINNTAVRLR